MKNTFFILCHVLGLFISGIAWADDCSCIDCADCKIKLNDPTCTTVYLTQDIIDHQGSNCIDWPADDKIFDCQGHMIDGDGPALINGINMENHSGNHIRNCVISDCVRGIMLKNVSDNEITNNDLTYVGTGILLDAAVNTVIQYNDINNHADNGIEVKVGSDYTQIRNNTIMISLACGIKFKNVNSATINNNVIRNHNTGIYFENSEFNSVHWNIVCNNLSSDFLLTGANSNNTGTNNKCDYPGGWNDNLSTGCTYTCAEQVPSVSEWGIMILVLSLAVLVTCFTHERGFSRGSSLF